jgi:periplasmic protein TonB
MSSHSRQDASKSLGSLQACLVEGDAERQTHERQLRRRALIISIAMQSVALAGLVLIPLLGKPARIALANVTPLPPYYSHPEPRHPSDPAQPRHPHTPNVCRFCAPTSIPPTVPTLTPEPPDDNSDHAPVLDGPSIPGSIPMPGVRDGVRTSQPRQPHPDAPRMVHTTHIDPALLTHRVEPAYPTLMRQIGRSGKVELRAIIATDGSIQSLQVVGGDPGFYQSALDAVRQWRYRPTVLNGEIVEVDTYITVIYNIAR